MLFIKIYYPSKRCSTETKVLLLQSINKIKGDLLQIKGLGLTKSKKISIALILTEDSEQMTIVEVLLGKKRNRTRKVLDLVAESIKTILFDALEPDPKIFSIEVSVITFDHGVSGFASTNK